MVHICTLSPPPPVPNALTPRMTSAMSCRGELPENDLRSLLECGDVDKTGEAGGDTVEADGTFFGVEGKSELDVLSWGAFTGYMLSGDVDRGI